jgi:hypothetical protein
VAELAFHFKDDLAQSNAESRRKPDQVEQARVLPLIGSQKTGCVARHGSSA